MNECQKRGCRKLKLLCEDCNRVVSTAHLAKEEENEWKDIERFPPDQDQPCEYKIMVTCRGWYRPNGQEAIFAPDERHPPQSSLCSWREWQEGPSFEEGVKLVREFRKQLMEKGNGHV